MFSKLVATILLFTLVSSITSSGHLRLDITPSNDCALRLITNVLHAESFWMTMGEVRTTSFHPLIEQDSIKVSFSVDGMTAQHHVYELRQSGKTKRDVLIFDQMVIMVEAIFECDKGFTGSRCQRSINKASSRRTTTSTTTTTTSSSTSTTSTSTSSSTTSTKEIPVPNSSIQADTNTILILVLVIIVLTILMLILAIFIITKRRSSIYIEPSIISQSLEIKKTDESLNSGISTQAFRYTVEPYTVSVLMTPC